MSDLTLNKILGAVLATGFFVVGLHEVSGMLFENEAPKKPGYIIEVQEAAGSGPAKEEAPIDWGTVLPTADAAKGQEVFAKCQSCHKPDDTNGTGPGLNGVVGRPPASHAGFNYSDGMKEFATKQPKWDYDHINAFITKPGKYIGGTKMTFVGLKQQQDRINVIAFLHTLNSSLPIPAPDPSRAPAAAGAAPAAGAAAPAAAGAPTATGSTAQAPAAAAPALEKK